VTALCGGGTSSGKPGYGQSVAFTASAIAALLSNIPTVWAVPLAGAIGLVTYNLSTFCNTDPPPVPTIVASDVTDLLNYGDFFRQLAAQQKFQQLVGAYAWFQMCQCDSGATPAAPAAPAAPANVPTVNPPVAPPIIGSAACSDTDRTFQYGSYPIGTVSGATVYNATRLYGNPTGPLVHVYSTLNVPSAPIPAGATKLGVKVTCRSGCPSAPTTVGLLRIWTSTTTAPNSYNITPTVAGTTQDFGLLTLPAGALYFSLDFDDQTFPSAQLDIEVSWYCGTATTGAPVQPCCPPDTVLSGVLDNILGLVTLIQRQQVPFAYTRSTVHAGLSGMGHISVQGLIGALVEVTDYGSNVGVEAGDPNELWNVGWIAWGNADGSSERRWIDNASRLSLPSAAGQYTRLGYSLKPGVTVRITELVRES